MAGPPLAPIATAVTAFQEAAAAMLEDCGDVPAAVIAHVQAQADTLAADLTRLAETIPDDDDLLRALTLFWAELKGEWIRHNLLMQYQLAEAGEPDPAIWLAGSVISGMLAAMEPLLPPAPLLMIDQVLGDPLQVVRPDGTLVQHLREQHQRSGRLVRTISNELNALFRAVLDVRDRLLPTGDGAATPDPQDLLQRLVDRVDRAFSHLQSHLRQESLIPFATLWPTVQADLESHADGLGLRCQISNDSDPAAGIDAQQVEGLLTLWVSAGRFLQAGLGAETADARLAGDKSLHGHLDVRCQSGEGGGSLQLRDDGPGLAPDDLPPEMAAAWKALRAGCQRLNVALEHHAEPGRGTTLTLRWQPFRYQQTDLLMIVRRGHDLVALPATEVGRVVPVPAGALHRTAAGRTFAGPDALYPWRELPGTATVDTPPLAMLCERGDQRLAIGIDATERLHATIVDPLQSTAFRPPPYLRGVARVGGSLCLVIDPWLLEDTHVPAIG